MFILLISELCNETRNMTSMAIPYMQFFLQTFSHYQTASIKVKQVWKKPSEIKSFKNYQIKKLNTYKQITDTTKIQTTFIPKEKKKNLTKGSWSLQLSLIYIKISNFHVTKYQKAFCKCSMSFFNNSFVFPGFGTMKNTGW